MEQLDPTAPIEERRRFYHELAKDPDFQALSDENRHDVARRILFPGHKEPSKILPKVAAGIEKGLTGIAKAAPFPGLIKAAVAPETVPEEQRNLGYLVQPLPEIVPELFQLGVEGVRKTLGHKAARTVEGIAGTAPTLPISGLARNISNLRLYGRRPFRADFEMADVTPPKPTALPSPEVPPGGPPTPPVRPQLISPARASAEVFEQRLAAEEALRQSPAGRIALARQLKAESGPPEGAVQFRPQPPVAITPQVVKPARRPPKGRPRKETIEAPVASPIEVAEAPPTALPDPIQARLQALGIEVPHAETQPPEVQAPAVQAAMEAETRKPGRPLPSQLTSKEVVAKIEGQQTPEHFDKPKITKQVEKGGEVYVKTEVDPNVLKVPGEKTVEPGISAPEKGPIVVDDKGKVIDGRHRVVDAKEAGEGTIEAYAPEGSKLAGRLPTTFIKVRKYEKGTVGLNLPAGKKSVDASLSEHFAIHKPLTSLSSRAAFTVSHRGTGMRIADVRNLTAAKRIVEQLETAPGAKWDFTEQKGMTRETGMIGKQIVDTKGEYILPPEVLAEYPYLQAKALTSSRGAILPDQPSQPPRYQVSSMGMKPGYWKVVDMQTGLAIKSGLQSKAGAQSEADSLNRKPSPGVSGVVEPPATAQGTELAPPTAQIAPGTTISPIAVPGYQPPSETLPAAKLQAVVGGIEERSVQEPEYDIRTAQAGPVMGLGLPAEREALGLSPMGEKMSDPIQKRLEALGIEVPEKTPLIEAIEIAEAAMLKDETAVDTVRQTHALEKVEKALVGVGSLPSSIQQRLKILGIDIPPESGQITTKLPDPIEQRLRDLGIETEALHELGQPGPHPSPVDVRQPAEARPGTPPTEQAPGLPRAQDATSLPTGGEVEVGGPGRRGGVRLGGGEPLGTGRRPGLSEQPPRADTVIQAGVDLAETGGPVGRPRETKDVNHTLPTDRDWIPVGDRAKSHANLEAIRTLKVLEAEDRNPTPQEKEVLARYTGWGGLKEVFDEGKAEYREYPPRTQEQKIEAANWEKNWGKLYDEVKEVLTADEYAAAAKSMLTSHYTSREVVNAMWHAVEWLGFRGGNALEPAAGIGHFIGLQPESTRGATKWRGVELDSISATIAQRLYPEARIEERGFETAKIPLNSQDLVVSNVPFGADGPIDKRYPRLSLHNYFIVHGLDLVRPGGIMAVVTSDSTMDNPGIGTRARELIDERADLIAAIRLPNTAFKKGAGTEVTTDILFFRKRDGTAFEGASWRRSVPAKTDKGEGITINEYYVRNPDMMLGRMSREGTMYGPDQQALVPFTDRTLTAQLDTAIAKLPENIAGPQLGEAIDEAETVMAETGQKTGAIVASRHGVMRVTEDLGLEPLDWGRSPKKIEQAKRYIAIRDFTREMIARQFSSETTEAQIVADRQELNRLYDTYVKRHGPISTRASSFLDDDGNFPLILALEDGIFTTTETVRGGKPATLRETTWVKGKIFSERTLFPREEPSHADTILDGLEVSMNYRGKIDLGYIAKLTGQNAETVAAEFSRTGAAFENPKTGLWETRTQYLSGFVKDKLREAQQAAEDEPRFLQHVAELEKIQPAPILINEIGFKLGSRWIPTQTIEAFIKELLDVDATVGLTAETGSWHIQARSGQWSELNNTVYGIHDWLGHKLAESALNLKLPVVTDRVPSDTGKGYSEVKNQPKTLQAQAKQQEIQRKFKEFVLSTPEVAANLAQIYNETFNGVVAPKFEAPTWTQYPGASTAVTLREHQKAVVSRILQNSTLLAHGVGTGKTFIQITAAMEMRRLGIAKKPMIVVQNATIEQFPRAFKELYPGAKILVPNAKQRDAINRNKTMSRIATGDWDAVIVPQSFLNMLPDNVDRVAGYVQDRLAELRTAKITATREEGKRSPKPADLQRAIDRLEKRLEDLAARKQDQVITFEELGVDALFVDEAHAYKKLEFFTKMDNVKGLDKSASQRGFSMYMKTRYVQEKNQGRNVIFATGTPISNTITEAWNMMRYVRPDVLKQYQMEDFDSFAGLFGDTLTRVEITATGQWKLVTRFAKFTNGPELIAAWRTTADVVFADELNLPGLPAVKGGGPRLVALEQSPELEKFIGCLRSEIERFEKMTGQKKRENSHIPLVVFTMAKKATVDMRMVQPTLPDQPGSKLNVAADEIWRIYQESTSVKGAQAVFLDGFRDNPRHPRFNAYIELKNKLMKRGIPEREIAIGHGLKDVKREAVFDQVNRGDIRVIIGGTETIGTGVNYNEHLIAAHHLDAPLKPMQLEQRNGRIVRQGNQNPEVEIFNYGVKNSLDAAIYQKLATKQKFIIQIQKGEITGRNFEDAADEVSFNFEEIMAELSGDPRAIRKIALENEVRQLEMLRQSHFEQIRKARETIHDLTTRIVPTLQRSIAQADQVAGEYGAAFTFGTELALEIAGKTIKGRKEAISALDTYLQRKFADVDRIAREQGKHGTIATSEFSEIKLNGEDLIMSVEVVEKQGGFLNESAVVHWRLAGTDTHPSKVRTGQGLFQGLTAQLEAVARHPERLRGELASRERNLRELSSFIEKPFEREGELRERAQELVTLTAELQAVKPPVSTIEAEDLPAMEFTVEPDVEEETGN